MLLKIAYYGNPILRKRADPVKEINDEIRQLIKDMEETMMANNGGGLAAPQIGRSLRIFIVSWPYPVKQADGSIEYVHPPLRVFINPRLINPSEEGYIVREACISIPGVYEPVPRPLTITVEATGLDGNLFTEEFTEAEARCIMHENDHINGVLFIDRIPDKSKKDIENHLRAIKKKYN